MLQQQDSVHGAASPTQRIINTVNKAQKQNSRQSNIIHIAQRPQNTSSGRAAKLPNKTTECHAQLLTTIERSQRSNAQNKTTIGLQQELVIVHLYYS